jgi:putative peptide zinc metalloprotease protein
MTPTLRADVRVLPFDDFEGRNRFIVAVGERHFVVSEVVAAVLQESRTPATLEEMAQRTSARLGVPVSAELVSRVIAEQLLSICFSPSAPDPSGPTPSRPAIEGSAPQCPIRLRAHLIGARALQAPLAALSKLFTLKVALFVLALVAVVEVAIIARSEGGAAEALSGTEVLCAVALTLLGVFVHELGHLAACARFGATHGGIGVGLYWCMPVFYADVNGAWTLPRLQRAAVDAGGVYLQCIYVLALGAIYLATDAPAFREAIAWTFFLMLHTLNPVLKYDGYWLLTDLAGAPNLHARIRASAQQVWAAIRRMPDASLPATKPLLLLGTFTAIAFAYFTYLLLILGTSLGKSAGIATEKWAAEGALWQALGESAVLTLLLAMAVSLAFVLAQSIHRIGRISPP